MINFSVNNPNENIAYTKRIGCYAIITNDKNQIALVKTNNQYFLPGGGLEDGESLIECLERECFEEMGVTISDAKEFARGDFYFYSSRFNENIVSIGHFYTCIVLETSKVGGSDGFELEWLEVADTVEKLYLENQKEAVRLFSIKI